MEDNYLQESLAYNFLSQPDAKDVFAQIDYALKNGKHIQKHYKQNAMFQFINNNYTSLRKYYEDYFELFLNYEGQGIEKYYFIDFRKDNNENFNRGQIPDKNRYYLDEASIIIGFLLIRMYILEPSTEFKHSSSGLKRQILQEYEEYKPNLLRLFAGTNGLDETDYDLKSIESQIDRALKEFDKLGWIDFDKNEEVFEILPSSKRLLSIYEEQIRNIDILIKQNNS